MRPLESSFDYPIMQHIVKTLSSSLLDKFIVILSGLDWINKAVERTYYRNDSKKPGISEPKQIFCASNIESIQT